MDVAVHIEALTKRFGAVSAVDNFSLDVPTGDVFAFLGSNGSGKTTTFRCLLGIYTADAGVAHIQGKLYTSAQSGRVGYLPEERGIYTRSTVRDVLHYFAALHGIAAPIRTKRIDRYLERVGLTQNAEQKINQLSSGMQQKVQIGAAIIHEPSVLILDEPFKGLDPLNRQLFLDIFEEQRDKGATILYSTHVVDEVQRLANRVVMIKDGKRVLYGTIDEVREQYGSHTITISFSGSLPDNTALYIARREHNFAELQLRGNTDSQEVLRYLANQPNLMIREYRFDRPTLNTIFIEHAKTPEKDHAA